MKIKHYKDYYEQDIVQKLIDLYQYKNVHMVPKLEKIVINRGLGESLSNKKAIEATFNQFLAISGQKPILTKAKKAISNFKIRKDQVVGCKVTLRGKRMYDFLSKLYNIVLPKIKDFRGLKKNAFDNDGNYTLGIKEDSIFPEIRSEVEINRGFDITFVTSTGTSKEEALTLLKLFGMPVRKG